LIDVSLCQVDGILNPLSIFVAVENLLVPSEKVLQLFDHSLNHLDSVANRSLKFKDQHVEFFSQLLRQLLVWLANYLTLNLLFFECKLLDHLVFILDFTYVFFNQIVLGPL